MKNPKMLGVFVMVMLMGISAQALEQDFEKILRFEAQEKGAALNGWGGGPHATIHLDETTVHEGDFSVRLERDAESERGFTTITKSIPMDFNGEWVEMRGFLRTEDVTEFAGIWMRQDGPGGMVQFENMQNQGLKGTTEWTEYSIRLPLDEGANDLFFGFLVAGQGKAWADDLELIVDGKPLREAPEREREKTVLDTDQEFTSGSGITATSLTEIQVDNLATLGKVWGFLKYHHPQVAQGELQWDFELFRIMPAVLESTDRSEANSAMVDWLDRIGVPEGCDPCAEEPTDLHLTPELGWIRDADVLGEKLSDRLQAVHEFRFAGDENFYLSTMPRVGNPVFNHEPVYFNRTLPDAGYRLLAVFRTWNIIEYWFPYRDLMDAEWDTVLLEFIPRMVAADTWDDYRLEFFAFAAHIQDTHANIWSETGIRPPVGECAWPVEVRFIEDKATVAAYTDSEQGPKSGLEIGDIILKMDGVPLDTLIEQWSPYYCASNQSTFLNDLGRHMSRGDCGASGESEVEIERNGNKETIIVFRTHVKRPNFGERDRPGETFQLLSEEVAYLKLSNITIADVPDYLERASGTKGLVIDIRNYPGEFVVFALGMRLIEEETPFARFTVCDPSNPGAFTWGKSLSLYPEAPGYEGKVMVLVNEASISQAEYTAMALRAGPNAKVVGSTTKGADGNVSNIPLPGGLKLMISGIGVFYPDKTPTQRVGIVPDVFVEPTIAGTMAGRDEVLEEALRQILGGDVDDNVIQKMAMRP